VAYTGTEAHLHPRDQPEEEEEAQPQQCEPPGEQDKEKIPPLREKIYLREQALMAGKKGSGRGQGRNRQRLLKTGRESGRGEEHRSIHTMTQPAVRQREIGS